MPFEWPPRHVGIFDRKLFLAGALNWLRGGIFSNYRNTARLLVAAVSPAIFAYLFTATPGEGIAYRTDDEFNFRICYSSD